MMTNPGWNPLEPDRLDLGLDGFFGLPGWVLNAETGLSVRYVDQDRLQSELLFYSGLWARHAWWLGEGLCLVTHGGARYIFSLAAVDVRLNLALVWTFGRGLRDVAPNFVPLKGFLEWGQPSGPYWLGDRSFP